MAAFAEAVPHPDWTVLITLEGLSYPETGLKHTSV